MGEAKENKSSKIRDRFRLHTQNNGDAVTHAAGDGGRSISHSSASPSIEMSTRSHPSRSSDSTVFDARTSNSSKGKKSITTSMSTEVPAFLTPGGAPLTSLMAGGNASYFSKTTPIDRLSPFGIIETVPRSKGSIGKPPAYSKIMGAAEPRSKHQKVRKEKKWYGHWSTRKIILATIAIFIVIALAIGLSVGLVLEKKSKHVEITPTWRPAIESTWQLQLNGTVSNPSLRAVVYDVDLFSTTANEIANMQTLGRRVVCYFSIGTYEAFRDDAHSFPDSALGNYLDGSTTERYLDTRNQAVRNIMKARIQMAREKGCDGLDVGTLDSYRATSSFPLTPRTAINYLSYLATQSHIAGLAIGLRNCPEIVTTALDLVDFEVNESCVLYQECDIYQPFISAGKPVFHIEYMAAGNNTADFLTWACNGNGTRGFSTIVKRLDLGAWALDCPLRLPGFGQY